MIVLDCLEGHILSGNGPKISTNCQIFLGGLTAPPPYPQLINPFSDDKLKLEYVYFILVTIDIYLVIYL